MTILREIGTSFATSPHLGKIARWVSTCFGVGYAPFAPGTAGSVLGVLIYLLTWQWAAWLQVLAFVGLTLIAIGASEKTEKLARIPDPQFVVIDEVVGMWITLIFLGRADWTLIIIAFVLFRVLDIFKFFPISVMENLHGGMGIVMDDVAAGMLANLLLRGVLTLGWL